MQETRYKPLASRKAPKALGYQQPSTFVSITASSPAIAVMTDLRQVSAATIGAESTLSDATRTMMARNVRLLLVVAPDQSVVGLITARDTQGERPIQWLHDRGSKYTDLRVSDLMINTEDMDVLDIKDVLHSEVGHIVASLKAWGRQHALVAEQDAVSGVSRIRGIFSATQIGRQLGVAVQPFDVAVTFADIARALAD
ncbi:MAG: CBS domain-containing protein [Steroidobacteraceae bacterium]|jgi:CBS-domain-containing membrane protein